MAFHECGCAQQKAASPYQDTATRWFRAKELLEAATLEAERAQNALAAAQAEEMDAWRSVEIAAGRGNVNQACVGPVPAPNNYGFRLPAFPIERDR
jgi:hypothetical protein